MAFGSLIADLLYRETCEKEFVTVLGDKRVNAGNEIILSCEVNTKCFSASWKKNGERLNCVTGKHCMKQTDELCSLKIQNADKSDEGIYTLEVSNCGRTVSCSAMVTVALQNWREIKQTPAEMERALRIFTIHPEVKELRFLLHGPVGAGKSSIINTIKSIFEKRLYFNCLVGEAGTSFTLNYQKFTVGSANSGYLPFAFYDVMGFENGEINGARTEDIISALKGHMSDGYKFMEHYSINRDNRYYIDKPTLNNKIHCLVSILPADRISLMDQAVIDKMRSVGSAAKGLGIPQMVFMTKVDKACPMTEEDLSKIFRSKKIKDKMQECSNMLGVPLYCIFPVKNYHEETELDEEINRLMLAALMQITHSANDVVERWCSDMKHVE